MTSSPDIVTLGYEILHTNNYSEPKTRRRFKLSISKCPKWSSITKVKPLRRILANMRNRFNYSTNQNVEMESICIEVPDNLDRSISLTPSPSPSMNTDTFSQIPADVQFMILRMLDDASYCNLAFTCKYWYQLAISAPMSYKACMTVNHTTMGCPTPGSKRTDCILRMLKSRLFRKIIINNLTYTRCQHAPLICYTYGNLQFLLDYISMFDIRNLVVKLPVYSAETARRLHTLADNADQITLEYPRQYGLSVQPCAFNRTSFFETHLSNPRIVDVFSNGVETANFILKQYVDGKRPNLLLYYANCHTPASGPRLNALYEGIRFYVRNEDTRHYESNARIVVQDLPILYVQVYNNVVTIRSELNHDDSYKSWSFDQDEPINRGNLIRLNL